MKIVNLEKSNASLALCCESLGGYHIKGREERERFLIWHLEKGTIKGKIAFEGSKRVGWIDYFPRGNRWQAIGCLRVNEEEKGRGVGRALVKACLEDCRGGKGVYVGATVWEHMPKSFFARMGFVDPTPQSSVSRMVFSFRDETPPTAATAKFFPDLVEGRLVVDMFDDGECPTSYVTRQLVKQAAQEIGDGIVVREHDMKEDGQSQTWGDLRGIFLNGRESFFGYPGELAKIRDDLAESLERVCAKPQ